MKEWILYCLLCSLIYAMSVQAKTQQEMTGELVFWNNQKYNVIDCAILIPSIENSVGPGKTQKLSEMLSKKGYNPIVSPSLQIVKYIQRDGSHQAVDYYTDRHMTKLKDNGVGTAYIALTGERVSIRKTHRFTLHLYRVGRATEILARSSQAGTLGQPELDVSGLPNCQPKDLE